MVEQLRELVRAFVAGQIGYADFRREFVRFSTASDTDPAVEWLYDLIESGCSAYDHSYINERGLTAHLVGRVLRNEAVNLTTVDHDLVLNPTSVFDIVAFAASNVSVNSIAAVGSENIARDERILELAR